MQINRPLRLMLRRKNIISFTSIPALNEYGLLWDGGEWLTWDDGANIIFGDEI